MRMVLAYIAAKMCPHGTRKTLFPLEFAIILRTTNQCFEDNSFIKFFSYSKISETYIKSSNYSNIVRTQMGINELYAEYGSLTLYFFFERGKEINTPSI